MHDYTYRAVHIVHSVTKLAPSTYCHYNSWQLTVFYTLYFIINERSREHFNAIIVSSL